MRRARMLAAALAAALLLPAAAAAKGPAAASITGPGLSHAIQIDGYGEGANGTPLGILVEQSGFFAQVFGQTPSPTRRTRPADELGPRYEVTYTVPGPDGDSTLSQQLYPYAANGPASYMAPLQRFWGTQSTLGGWFRGSPELVQVLVRAGLPASAPQGHAGRAGSIVLTLGAGGVAAAGLGLALFRRRRTATG